MTGIVRAMFSVPRAYIKLCFSKLCHPKSVKFGSLPRIDSSTEISFQGKVKIGKRFNMRRFSTVRCRKNGTLIIGNYVSLGTNNTIVCLDEIKIGDNCEFGPNVAIFDHDHDFKTRDGLQLNKYNTSPISIGDNVWIGANSIILRGTTIGNNCVIAAGSIIKGNYPDNSIVVQKKDTQIIEYSFEDDNSK